ncbi:MAG: molecular chaperone DnaJ [Verrucomicrobia bacterium]|nr:MAG: molecular chaperone DnaJ [Verrucomicrobiota bacterium]
MRSERFRNLVEQSPDNIMFRFSLGQALHEEGSHLEAVEHLQACVSEKADWMMAQILLGKSLLALGRREEARPALEAALRLAIEQKHETPEAEIRALLKDLG